MKRTYALLAACSLAFLAFAASAVPTRTSGGTPHPAPPLQFRTLDGKEIGPKDFAGKVVLVDFWATWCGYCARARPEVEAITRSHSSEPFARISISADSNEQVLRSFLAEHPPMSHQVWDGGGQLSALFNVQSLPTHVLIDPSGQVVHTLYGWSDGYGADLARAIDTELGKLSVPPRRKA
ncbi:MAG TPA: TlpA disulfide reductase family protein [Thermoanaerobaculia bacterium]|nr:TlpA disulfide reductase family protein [Thermoanaerobaculia bacterium]